jgi:hypothetical protein
MTIDTRYLSRILLGLFTLFIALALSAQEKGVYVWPVKLQKDYSKSYPWARNHRTDEPVW